jgi:hypothetical protein
MRVALTQGLPQDTSRRQPLEAERNLDKLSASDPPREDLARCSEIDRESRGEVCRLDVMSGLWMVVQIGVKMADRIADGLLPRPDVSQERAAPYVVRLAQIRRPPTPWS